MIYEEETPWSKYVMETAKEMPDTPENKEYARKLWEALSGDVRWFDRDANTGELRVYIVKGKK